MEDSPIHQAAEEASYEAVASLLDAGCEVDALNAHGQTALLVALCRGARSIVALLLDAGADVHVQVPGTGGALHVAAGCGRGDFVAQIVEAGCGVDSENDLGETALHIAAFYGTYEAMRVLLRLGADPSALSGNGSSPLHVICEFLPVNALLCTRLLLAYGANESSTNGDGLWPSMLLRYYDVEGEGGGSLPSNEATNAIDSALSRARSDRVWSRRCWVVLLAASPLKGKRVVVTDEPPWLSTATFVVGLERSHPGLFRQVVECL